MGDSHGDSSNRSIVGRRLLTKAMLAGSSLGGAARLATGEVWSMRHKAEKQFCEEETSCFYKRRGSSRRACFVCFLNDDELRVASGNPSWRL